MTAPRTRKDRDVRRDQILAAARDVFQRRSFEEVSTTELAAAAGVSRGLLNHYFGTKRGLYFAAVEAMLEVPPVEVLPFSSDADLRTRISASVDGWLVRLERNRETWLAALDRAAPRGDAQFDQLMDVARESTIERVVEVVGLSELAQDHVQVEGVLHAFGDMALRASREWLEHGRLTRAQTRRLLESSLIHLIEEVIPELTGQDDRPARGED